MTSFDFGEYIDDVDESYKKHPAIYLENLLSKCNPVLKVTDVLKLIVDVEKLWKSYLSYDVQCGIILMGNSKRTIEKNIINYNFLDDIKTVIQSNHQSILYFIDKNGCIIEKKLQKDFLKFTLFCQMTEASKSLGFLLGVTGVDTVIAGIPFKSENHLDSYQDIINLKGFISIANYKDLLNKFFETEVQYDPYKQYFVRKKHLPKEKHHLLEKYPKLLHIKPEETFQINLIKFLKRSCTDEVLSEVSNKYGDRYDVWVTTSDNKIYVFEIKWLGASLTAKQNAFDKYNNSERAIEGAYQLKNYIDGEGIYCGVLITYDARIEIEELQFPELFKRYPNIDLSQHFKMEKNKIPASQVYQSMKKGWVPYENI